MNSKTLDRAKRTAITAVICYLAVAYVGSDPLWAVHGWFWSPDYAPGRFFGGVAAVAAMCCTWWFEDMCK